MTRPLERNLHAWIASIRELCRPKDVVICDGSPAEYDRLVKDMVRQGVITQLNPIRRPYSFLAKSDPRDVARVEERTFICSEKKDDAGPTNNWRDPQEMREKLQQLFRGSMEGRTLYVVPFLMGPLNSPFDIVGVELTDSPYVVCNMHLMTKVGKVALASAEKNGFVPCVHSVGKPLAAGEKDVHWPCNPEEKHIVHFPESREVWSFGSGYGGNALLGKKSLALRIASVIARDDGWLAEHMLILGLTNPQGQKKYIVAAFPSACGKTNLAMMQSSLPGWKVETVGDDIAWLRFRADGRLWAVNPEAGFFGVAPGTSWDSNPHAMETIAKNAFFTNVASTKDGDVWWEGMTKTPPAELIDWQGKPWTPENQQKASHPNARFTVSAAQCPVIDHSWQDPQGVPIDAILFGGRRSSVVPLICESLSWNHGVFFGATMSSETTAAAAGEIGKLRRDPFAMLPFCGYHMADYWSHWLSLGQNRRPETLPRFFQVNWFRKNKSGEWLWPGYGENSRVLKWIFERCSGEGKAVETPLGFIPTTDALDLKGLLITPADVTQLLAIDPSEWTHEVPDIEKFFKSLGDKVPSLLYAELDALKRRLGAISK